MSQSQALSFETVINMNPVRNDTKIEVCIYEDPVVYKEDDTYTVVMECEDPVAYKEDENGTGIFDFRIIF
jgi:hypothetical protein